MKLVLDNNIFISASFWQGKPYDVLERMDSCAKIQMVRF
jgi:predicted nucleic acid-binding protein